MEGCFSRQKFLYLNALEGEKMVNATKSGEKKCGHEKAAQQLKKSKL